MIARPEWFTRRKYGGWGLTPKTWQGWVYIAIVIAIPLILTLLASDTKMLIIFIGVWMILLAVDTIPVMIGIKKDEREAQVEAIAERNTAWFMSIVLVFSVVYDISRAVIER